MSMNYCIGTTLSYTVAVGLASSIKKILKFAIELSFCCHCYNYIADGVMECIDPPYMTITCLYTFTNLTNNEKKYKTKLQTILRCNLTSYLTMVAITVTVTRTVTETITITIPGNEHR